MPRTTIVYVGAATTNASAAFQSHVSLFKQKLRDSGGAIILEWDASAQPHLGNSLYERDTANIRGAHIFIALLGEPSIGLGMEIAEAMRERKPVLALYPHDSNPSRLLQAAAESGYVELRPYSDINRAQAIACEFVERHAQKYRESALI
jgi:hypothetical protein